MTADNVRVALEYEINITAEAVAHELSVSFGADFPAGRNVQIYPAFQLSAAATKKALCEPTKKDIFFLSQFEGGWL